VVILLPENKHLIIDAKVSLTSYERYCAEDDEDARALHLKDFLTSIRAHVNGLEQRRYQDTDKLGTPDFVFMFLPIEGAYSLAMQKDPELHSHAWGKKIFIVCPATLMATLKTVALLWRAELQNRNTLEIARQGGNLYDKVAGFVDDMQTLGKRIGAAQETYEDAFKKLSSGRGSIVSRTEELRALGVKTSKKMPAQLLGNDEEDTLLKKVESN
jgi:DNA recombination protein RmuC